MRPWRFAVEPFCIADNFYYVGNKNVSAHLIDTGDGLILLDTAFPQTVYLLLESVRKLGFDPADIARILHSHAHYDHMGGTRAIVELTGAKTYLGVGDVEFLRSRTELTWAAEYGVEFSETFDLDVALKDGDMVALGNTEILCVHTPGHTPGATSWFFDVTWQGSTCRVGFHGGPGHNTLTDEFLARYDLPDTCRADFARSIDRLRQEHVDIHLGLHPNQSDTLAKAKRMTETDNPFIDPQRWGAFLDGCGRNIPGAS